MEQPLQKSAEFIVVGMKFTGRDQRPPQTFESALRKAAAKSSPSISFACELISVVDDPENQVQRREYRIPSYLAEKIFDGTLLVPKEIPTKVESQIKASLEAKEKRRLKHLTRVSRKHS